MVQNSPKVVGAIVVLFGGDEVVILVGGATVVMLLGGRSVAVVLISLAVNKTRKKKHFIRTALGTYRYTSFSLSLRSTSK